jgi:hypothetical protein
VVEIGQEVRVTRQSPRDAHGLGERILESLAKGGGENEKAQRAAGLKKRG